MSLLFKIRSRLVIIAFLPRSKHLLISWLQPPSAVILEPKKIKSVTLSVVSSSICHEVLQPDAVILVFWMLSFKPALLLSSFNFIERLFSSSSLAAIRVVSSAYLKLLIFLPAVLIPACASSYSAFRMMYSAYKVNKQGDSIQHWCTPFPVWNQTIVLCPVLFLLNLHTDFSGAGQVVWYSHPFQNFPQFVVIHTVKGFGMVNKAEVDVFLELSCFSDDPKDFGNLISASSVFSESSLNIWKFSVLGH